LKNDLETERITQDEIINSFLAAEMRGVTEDLRKATYEATDKLEYNDLKKFHVAQMSGKPFTYCIVASEKKVNMDDVKKCGPVKKLTLSEIFGY
jgi:hypothetical protein